MRKGCLIAAIVVFAILSIGLGYYFYDKSKSDPTVYELAKPEYQDIIKKTVATGSIKPRKEVQIKPQVSGVVDQLYVEEGELVQKGQQIARIKLIPNEVNINSAQSSLELAQIRLRDAKRELDRQEEINEKSLDIQNALASYNNAKREEERYKKLFEDGVVSEQEYNQFQLDMELAKAVYDNAVISAQNSLRSFETDVDIREQELEAAQNNLQLLKEGASSKSKQVSNIVTSTLDGMVLDIPVEEGSSVIERNNFNEGTSIAAIADMNTLIFEGKVDESEVGKLKEGMPIELTVGAIDDLKFPAILEHIAPKGEVEEGTVKFKIVAAIQPTEEVFLRAGYSASGDIILERRDSVLSISERDLIIEEDTTWVEVSVGDKEFEKRKVETGLSDGLNVHVVNGLDTTDRIKVLKDQ